MGALSVFVLCAYVTNGEQHEDKVECVARVRFSPSSNMQNVLS